MEQFVQGVKVYMRETGQGEPLLFLHGAPDTGEMWSGVIKHLGEGYHCFAPDLPGFGQSVAPRTFRCSLEDMARFITELVERFALPTPLTLVVADFGATYGLSWFISEPQKVKRIIIAGGSNYSSRYSWHSDARMLRTPLVGELGMAMLTARSYEGMMRKNAPLVPVSYVRETFSYSLAHAATRRMMIKLYRSINAEDFRSREERLHHLLETTPALVLWGDRDPFITPDFAEQFASAQIEHFAENGHWLAVEVPEQVAARIKAFDGI